MMNIKPIDTIYKGYRFRSRLEARWAVFFDNLGCDWEYEKEGYELEDGRWYLPDFWINLDRKAFPGWGFWIEVKANEPTEDERLKLHYLSKGTGHTTYCFWGTLSIYDWRVTVYKGQSNGELLFREGKYCDRNSRLVDIENWAYWRLYLISPNDASAPLPFGYGFISQYETYKKAPNQILRLAFDNSRLARF